MRGVPGMKAGGTSLRGNPAKGMTLALQPGVRLLPDHTEVSHPPTSFPGHVTVTWLASPSEGHRIRKGAGKYMWDVRKGLVPFMSITSPGHC